MILTKQMIKEEVWFDPPLDVFQARPHAVDLRLACDVNLMPGVFTLCGSLEKVRLPNNVMGVVYPRSSLNRRGMALDMTGVVDAGYEGFLVLPITNCNDMPVPLRKGERVASIVFHRLEEPVEPELSKYHKGGASYVPDGADESAMIASGDIDGLKARYRA